MKLSREHMKQISVAPEPKDLVLQAALTDAAKHQGVPRELLKAVAWVESRYNVNARNPKTGALGWFQFMPGTAREMGIDPLNPVTSAHAAAKYLKDQYARFAQDWSLAVAAYDWGPAHVAQHPDNATWPRETKDYLYAVWGGAGWPLPFPGTIEFAQPRQRPRLYSVR